VGVGVGIEVVGGMATAVVVGLGAVVVVEEIVGNGA
jgi:hypothetical protein